MKSTLVVALALLSAACSPDRATGIAPVTAPRAPLVFLDGREVRGANLDAMSDLPIDRVEVVRGSAAIARYGDRARNGVVLITTKQTR